MDSKKYRFETLQIHAGLQPDEPTGARGVAIYPTAAYRFKNCDHAARLFELSEGGNIYTRLQNPTTTAYEQRIAALYGAVGALAVSSGMSAILIAVLSLAAEGDNIVASPFLYGGTYNQFRTSLRRLGIDCRIAPSERPEDFEALTDSRTKALYAESMGNPTCAVPDLEALGELARLLQARARELGLRLLGPIPAPLAMLRGRRRFSCLIKSADWQSVRALYHEASRQQCARRLRLFLDLDPVNML